MYKYGSLPPGQIPEDMTANAVVSTYIIGCTPSLGYYRSLKLAISARPGVIETFRAAPLNGPRVGLPVTPVDK